ncbi:FAD-dependent oxidoreductase [Streptomyces sp. NPDC015131]|uniref:FAD-dependent oxidoreductase n=1 Tax=Streptomyces sp. NPDC015131 TaxID=3364941 RepID=UPI0036FF3848
MTGTRAVDVLVVGAGPAGLAAARRLAARGAGTVEVLERERGAGRGRDAAVRAGAVLRTGTMATGWSGPLTLDVTGPAGRERVTARAVVLATGARERPRGARLVPGTRPAGVLTTGELTRTAGLGRPVGTRAVVVGAEPVSWEAVRTLRRAGVAVAAVVTGQSPSRPRALTGPLPVLGGTAVAEVLGRGRVSGVRLRREDGRTAVVRCDTVVFTGDWVPEYEVARSAGAEPAPGTRGPSVDGSFRTTVPGVFAVGGLVLPGAPSSRTARAGRAVARPVLDFLADPTRAWPRGGAPVVAGAPLRWVTPHRLGAPGAGGRFLVRADRPLVAPVLVVRQDGALLYRRRWWRCAGPYRPVALPGGWAARADPAGGPVEVTVC